MTSKAEENLEILGDYLLKQDFSSLNPLLSDSAADKSDTSKTSSSLLVETTPSGRSGDVPYPKYTATNEQPSLPNSSRTSGLSSPKNIFSLSSENDRFTWTSPIMKRGKTHDQQLARWQARQVIFLITNCFINGF